MATIEKTSRGYRVIAENGTQTHPNLTQEDAHRIKDQWDRLEARNEGIS